MGPRHGRGEVLDQRGRGAVAHDGGGDEVGGLDLSGQHLPDGSPVVGAEGEASLGQQVVAEQVVDQGGRVDEAHHPGDLCRSAPSVVDLVLQEGDDGLWVGADGQGKHHLVPAPVLDELVEGGNEVLSHGAGQAGVVECVVLVVADAVPIGDDSSEPAAFHVCVEVVAQDHRVRQVQQQTAGEGLSGDEVDGGHDQDRHCRGHDGLCIDDWLAGGS